MLVSQIMTTKVRSVAAMASPKMAIELMTKGRLKSLPVVDDDGTVVGLLSEADVARVDRNRDTRAHLRPEADMGKPAPQFVQDLMTRGPHTVTEETDLAEAARVFGDTTWDTLPVVRGAVLVGMLSRVDVDRSVAAVGPLTEPE